MHRILYAVIALLLMLIILPGCSSEPPASPTGADEIAEALILAYDANDYRAYLNYFDEAATGSVGQDWFSETSQIITKKIGHYIPNSKVVKEVKPSGEYTEVTYKAQYADESDVTVIVDLIITGDAIYAAGIWFNSPKLFK